jgi:hypothetical protein
MGPGPINAHPRVLRAMSADMLGQFDPEMTFYMNETMALYRQVFMTENRWTFLVDGTRPRRHRGGIGLSHRTGSDHAHSAHRALWSSAF